MNDFLKSLDKEQLIQLFENYAKNWIAHDGCWFQSIEKKLGMEEAIEHDANAWEVFTVVEAKRAKQFLGLGENSGLEGLKKALMVKMQYVLNQGEFEMQGNSLIYKAVVCRVQYSRARKNMDAFPCKPVGLVEYSGFAKEIDSRITTECISCPPDVTDPSCGCIWKFTLNE